MTTATAPSPTTRFRVPHATLKEAVSRVTRILNGARSEFKILHFDITPDGLQIAAQNETSKLRITVPAETTDTYSFRMPSDLLGSILSNIREQEVTLEATDTELFITAGEYRSNLRIHAASNAMRDISFPDNTSESTLTGEDITTLLAHTMDTIAKGDHNAVFRNLLLHFSPQHSRAVGSDGYRLAYRNAPPVEALGEKNVLIPGKQTEHLLRNFPTGSIRIHATNAEVTFQTDTATFTTKVDSGEYPEYERIIPSKFLCRFQVNAPELRAALNRASILTDESSKYRVDLMIQGFSLALTGETQGGMARETIPITVLEDNAATPIVAINSRYLKDALKPLDGDAVISISGATSPLVITPADNNDYVSVIVPLRTDA